ncbi:MAG: DPP IV N-terminal domain-containing protein [Bryobacterales bacterium]|nr:DPP IV N-terminal domain-containing protein [Bryobacterales bacterium]
MRSKVRRLRVGATLAVVSVLTLLPGQASEDLAARLRRIFTAKAFAGKTFGPARWIHGGASYTTLEAPGPDADVREVIQYETASGKRTVLVSAAQLTPQGAKKPLAIEDYHWDRELGQLLVFNESRRTWRTNTRGDYWLLQRKTGHWKKLGGDAPASSLMFAKFSPDGALVSYVRDNDLYVEDVGSGAIRKLTADGSANIVNGSGDWVYEEELNLRDAVRWAPDSRSLAFWQFDESGVQRFTMINNTDSLYPKLTEFPYPKAGTRNPAARIGVVSAAGGAVRWIALPGDARENYVFRMDWVDARRLAIGQVNRRQNRVTIYLADAESGEAKVLFRDEDEAWIDLPESAGAALGTESFTWVQGRKAFLWLSERDGWRRVYAVGLDGGAPVAVTPAGMDAMAVAGVDGQWIYYIASPYNATERYLYRAALGKVSAAERVGERLPAGTHSYDISPDARWALHVYSALDVPPVTSLVRLPGHERVRVMEDNAELRTNAASVITPAAEFLKVTVADGVTLDGWMLKPRSFDAKKKYPVVVYVYGEPFGSTVANAWNGNRGLFHRALADEGFLVVSFDNRGTPLPKGRAWRKVINGAVGVLSTKDQTEAVLALAKDRPYVDLGRVGVWGWSGGGTNTLNLMFRSPELFRVGVSIAPVPDQRLYDSIYQERYMGTPEENAAGYRAGSAIHFAEGLQGNLLYFHGSGDDNVHYQGTEKLMNRLIELGKPFDFMSYPNRSHAISEGAGTSLHLYSLMARYFLENLKSPAQRNP